MADVWLDIGKFTGVNNVADPARLDPISPTGTTPLYPLQTTIATALEFSLNWQENLITAISTGDKG